MKTFASLFSGGGGADIGAFLAGLKPIWAVEIDPQVASIYATNIKHYPIVKSITQVDPKQVERPDVLWASPPCQAYSIARDKNLPSRDDADIGLAIIPFLEILQPPTFILENVEGYRKSKVFFAIVDALYRLGYWINWEVLNAADFGVPQTRRRLILLAIKNGFVPSLPQPQKWCGWYEAIADLIPNLQTVELAAWQLKRLQPDKLANSFLIDSKNASGAVAKNIGKAHTKQTIHYAPQISQEALPIFSRQYSFPNGRPTVRLKNQPSFTICAAITKGLPKAVLIERHGARNKSLNLRSACEPAWTIRASIASDGKGGNRKTFINACVESQVFNLNIRALARLQTFPDWYIFPESTALAGQIIGNAVPPLMAKSLILNIIS